VRVLATDIDTAEPVVFKEGDVREAVPRVLQLPGGLPADGHRRAPPLRRRRVGSDPGQPGPRHGGERREWWSRRLQRRHRWPSADSFVAVALRAGLTLLRGRSRNELAGADLVIAPSMGESGWSGR
jgi:hypothetical protein